MSNKVYEVITDRIITLLNNGVIPWKKPWIGHSACNFLSKKEYRGINAFLLNCASYSSPYFLTFKQALSKGGVVKKGEKGWPVVFWKILERDDNGTTKKIPIMRYSTVFNLDQVDGIEIPKMTTREHVPIDKCEEIVSKYMSSGPTFMSNEARAYYRPSDDCINMPDKNSFDSPEHYYSVLFHEMTHSTGHASRLSRKGITDALMFGSHQYSKEELIAECGSAFLCGESGITPSTIDNSAAYIGSWLKTFKNDVRCVVDAASAAQRASDLILGRKESEAASED